jgi:hypothetical protein
VFRLKFPLGTVLGAKLPLESFLGFSFELLTVFRQAALIELV